MQSSNDQANNTAKLMKPLTNLSRPLVMQGFVPYLSQKQPFCLSAPSLAGRHQVQQEGREQEREQHTP
jgi:hypothetical protein